MPGPVLICGCPGSGTSFVTKMLRHAGMFAGSDAGPMDARKYHESQCFVDWNKRFLTETIDFPYAPKGEVQFLEHTKQVQESIQQLVGLVDQEELLNVFWGDVQPTNWWGWKDPRNSANAAIWRAIFPGLRVLVINRTWTKAMRRQKRGSLAGKWYRQESTAELRKMYLNPPGIDGLDTLHVEFDKVISDADEFRSLLTWFGLPDQPANDFENFLERVGIET